MIEFVIHCSHIHQYSIRGIINQLSTNSFIVTIDQQEKNVKMRKTLSHTFSHKTVHDSVYVCHNVSNIIILSTNKIILLLKIVLLQLNNI